MPENEINHLEDQSNTLEKTKEIVNFVIQELCDNNIKTSIYLLIKLENILKEE